MASAAKAGEELSLIKENGIFIVDDVAFIQEKHGYGIGAEIERRNIKKEFYLETRGDVLLRNKDVFRYWKTLGLSYMFLGIEAIDAEGLKKFRKRVTLGKNMEAIEFARSLGLIVAVNIIADPDWDEARFQVIRDWALSIPEIVNVSVNTPYPGTETWQTEERRLISRDYRLFDIQHCVLPTKLPLPRFYEELVKTQQVVNMKHMGFGALKDTAMIAVKRLLEGQTNFAKMLWKFSSVYDPKLQLRDHAQPVKYEIGARKHHGETKLDPRNLYVHKQVSRLRATDATPSPSWWRPAAGPSRRWRRRLPDQPSPFRKSSSAALVSAGASCWFQCPAPGISTLARRSGTNAGIIFSIGPSSLPSGPVTTMSLRPPTKSAGTVTLAFCQAPSAPSSGRSSDTS